MIKRKIIIIFGIVILFGGLLFYNRSSISLYFYLNSNNFKKDTEYILHKTHTFQKWFLRMPSCNDELIAFASINIFEDHEIMSIERIKKYNVKLVFCNATYIAAVRSPESECDKTENYDNLSFLNILRTENNILVKAIDIIPFRCFDNKPTILTKDLKLVNSTFPDFIKNIKQISKEISVSEKVVDKHYLTFQANYFKNNWTIKVLCDEKKLTTKFPSILNKYESFIRSFDQNEIDYMFFTVLIW